MILFSLPHTLPILLMVLVATQAIQLFLVHTI